MYTLIILIFGMVDLIINIVNIALALSLVYLIKIYTYQTDFKPHRHIKYK